MVEGSVFTKVICRALFEDNLNFSPFMGLKINWFRSDQNFLQTVSRAPFCWIQRSMLVQVLFAYREEPCSTRKVLLLNFGKEKLGITDFLFEQNCLARPQCPHRSRQ